MIARLVFGMVLLSGSVGHADLLDDLRLVRSRVEIGDISNALDLIITNIENNEIDVTGIGEATVNIYVGGCDVPVSDCGCVDCQCGIECRCLGSCAGGSCAKPVCHEPAYCEPVCHEPICEPCHKPKCHHGHKSCHHHGHKRCRLLAPRKHSGHGCKWRVAKRGCHHVGASCGKGYCHH